MFRKINVRVFFGVFSIGSMIILSGVQAAEGNTNKQEKTVTVITGQTSADGKTSVTEKLLENCIMKLPAPGELEPQTESKVLFLHGINGTKEKDHVRTWKASIDLNYLVHEKSLVVVAPNAIQAPEPKLEKVQKTLQKHHYIESDRSSGDLFAGRSNRKYYFSSKEAAEKDVMDRARVWIKQKKGALCPESITSAYKETETIKSSESAKTEGSE